MKRHSKKPASRSKKTAKAPKQSADAPKPKAKTDSEAYLSKKAAYDQLLTVYGRNAVTEALTDPLLRPQRLHLSQNNKSAAVIDQMIALAEKADIEVRYHSPAALSRISKNAKQDQGVALDLKCPEHLNFEAFLNNLPTKFKLIALDGITNPQNVGMIIRSVTASPCDGLLLSKADTPKLSPLVIKASAGTLFRAPLIRSNTLADALEQLQARGTKICILDSNATSDFTALNSHNRIIYVLGNETTGVSGGIKSMADYRVAIPMQRNVESLNVAVTAALVAFS